MPLDHADYPKLVEEAYFGAVMACDLEAILACFTDDAEVIIYHGDNPVREFRKTPGKGETDLREFYAHLCGNYHPHFEGFLHVVDTQQGRAASKFTVTLTPRDDGLYAGEEALTLNNSNFFLYRDDKNFLDDDLLR